jgi:hypothetical protein
MPQHGIGNLIRHIKSVHTPREERDISLQCEICNKSFNRKDGKTVHMRRKHDYPKPSNGGAM